MTTLKHLIAVNKTSQLLRILKVYSVVLTCLKVMHTVNFEFLNFRQNAELDPYSRVIKIKNARYKLYNGLKLQNFTHHFTEDLFEDVNFG